MSTDPAWRPPVPPAPPSPGSPDELKRWMEALRQVDADVTRHGIGVAERHFAGTGRPMPAAMVGCTTWERFASWLAFDLEPIIHGDAEAPWLRPLLAERVHVGLVNRSGDPANRLAELLAPLIRHVSIETRRQRILGLLPEGVAPALAMIEAWEVAAQRRRDESGY